MPEGGVTALLGRNGVGKTTTLRALLGLVGRRGTIALRRRGHRRACRRTGSSGAASATSRRTATSSPALTVDENLRLAERDAEPRYDLVYDLFPELKQRGKQLAGTLSGGQQQMVAIARALLNDNRVLLVDEPTKGLAPLLVTEVAHVLERVVRADDGAARRAEPRRRRAGSRATRRARHRPRRHTGPAQELLDDSRCVVTRMLGVGAAAR